MKTPVTDEQLRFLNNLAEEHGDMLTKYAYRFLGYRRHLLPMAQDAVQETFIRAMRSVKLLMTHENPAGWLVVSLRYTLLTMLHEQQKRRECLAEDVTTLPAVTQQEALAALDRWEHGTCLPDVLEAVAEVLTAGEQEAFQDYFLAGYSTEETAAREGVSSAAVRGRINRIRKKLRKYWGTACVLLIAACYYL